MTGMAEVRYPKEMQTTEAKALAPPEICREASQPSLIHISSHSKAARPHRGCVFISASGISPASVIL